MGSHCPPSTFSELAQNAAAERSEYCFQKAAFLGVVRGSFAAIRVKGFCHMRSRPKAPFGTRTLTLIAMSSRTEMFDHRSAETL